MTHGTTRAWIGIAAAGLALLAGPTGCKKKAQVRDTTPTLPEELDPMLVRFEEAPVSETRAGRRPLVIFAMSADQPEARAQIDAVRESRAGFDDRDMLLVEVYELGVSRIEGRPMAPESARAWHEAYRASTWPVEIVLVGKDGGVKRRASAPVPMSEVYGQIDAMPVRRREVHERDRTSGP